MNMRWAAALVSAAMVASVGPVAAGAQEAGEPEKVELRATAATTGIPELRRLEALIDGLERAGVLVLTSRRADRYLAGRVHEDLRQVHHGVPVQGGGVSRQLDNGAAVSILGTVYREIDVDPTPRLAPGAALARLTELAGVRPASADPPALVVLPGPPGAAYVLAWRAPMRDRHTWFLDAHTGAVVRRDSTVQHQNAVGVGRGARGQRKKIAVWRTDSRFEARDRLRPGETVTLDLRKSEDRFNKIADGEEQWTSSDVASDDDNDWDNRAVVDAHAHAGFTYDYLAQQQRWNGVDGKNGQLLVLANLGIADAFFAPSFDDPDAAGIAAFGEEDDGTPMGVVDIVAHELMHGVTYHSVLRRTGEEPQDDESSILGPASFTLGGVTYRCGMQHRLPAEPEAPDDPLNNVTYRYACRDGRFLLFAQEGGAVNEAFSDIVGTAVELWLHDPPDGPLQPDYKLGEDSGLVTRELDDPRSARVDQGLDLYQPDAFSRIIRFLQVDLDDGQVQGDEVPDRFYGNIATADGGATMIDLDSYFYAGVHWNSTILSHAFYLAIEGGRNRTTGKTVQGVGRANRLEVERAFFRAMTDLIPAKMDFAVAAAAIRQSALDLYGSGGATRRAIDQALDAVGL